MINTKTHHIYTRTIPKQWILRTTFSHSRSFHHFVVVICCVKRVLAVCLLKVPPYSVFGIVNDYRVSFLCTLRPFEALRPLMIGLTRDVDNTRNLHSSSWQRHLCETTQWCATHENRVPRPEDKCRVDISTPPRVIKYAKYLNGSTEHSQYDYRGTFKWRSRWTVVKSVIYIVLYNVQRTNIITIRTTLVLSRSRNTHLCAFRSFLGQWSRISASPRNYAPRLLEIFLGKCMRVRCTHRQSASGTVMCCRIESSIYHYIFRSVSFVRTIFEIFGTLNKILYKVWTMENVRRTYVSVVI